MARGGVLPPDLSALQGMQPLDIAGRAYQEGPLGLYRFQPSRVELPESHGLFDDAENRFGRSLQLPTIPLFHGLLS